MEQNNIHGDNIRGDKHEHYHEAPHIIPKLLTQKSGLASVAFVGREKELAKITELLNRDSALLLLNGIGGIGKSTLASYYFNKERDKFDYCGFIEVGEDIKSSFSLSFSTSLDLKSEKIDDSFNEAMNKLQNLEGDKLLVLDDVKNIATQKNEINTILTLKNSGFKILFTSREVEENIPQYYLDTMSKEDARKLFLQYYPTDEIEKVDRILEYLDYHTLFVEMTAKTLEKRKRTLSLNSMIEKFESGEFSNIIKDKEESFSKLLRDLFSNDKILKDEENLLFLKRLSVLPSIEISFDDLHTFLVCEDNEKLEILLNELVDNGWLIESNGMYKFHQILKEFIWKEYAPCFEEIQVILFYYNSLISLNENVFKTAMDNKNKQIFFHELSKYLLFSKIENSVIGDFFHNLGIFYQQIEDYETSSVVQKKASILREKFENESLSKASSDDSLAILYKEQGKYEDALPLYENALKIRENILGTEDLETAASYNNLGVIYRILGENDKAMKLYKKCLKIKEREHGKEDPSTAQTYNNIALVYSQKKDYKKSIIYYNKALKVWQREYGEKHQDTAKCYNNLGVAYGYSNNFDRAIEVHTKALNIRKEILGDTNYTAQSYFNLGGAYLYKIKGSRGYKNDAIKNIEKSIKIWEKDNPSNPQLIEARTLLSEVKKMFSKNQSLISEKKLKRNAPCTCGSGKKYKQCCGKTNERK